MRYKFTLIVFVLTPLTLEECLKSPISSICFLFTIVFYLKHLKKSSIYSNCFNSPLIVSFPPFLSRFRGPENDTISGVDSIYTILFQLNFKSNNRFFRITKIFFLRHANFCLFPIEAEIISRKNDDFFPIRAFPIRAEDSIYIQ